jgi:hypothetical protein
MRGPAPWDDALRSRLDPNRSKSNFVRLESLLTLRQAQGEEFSHFLMLSLSKHEPVEA